MIPESATAVASPPAEAARDVHETLIQPLQGWQSLQWAEVWAHRHLIYFMTWRDLKVRYKQTALGALWAIIQPVLLMVVFGVVFKGNAGKAEDGLPYPVFLYAGLLPWTFVSQSTSKAAMSLVSSEQLIAKVYFPRLVIPISAVVGALVDFAIASCVLGFMIVWYQIPLSSEIFLLPVAVLLLCLVSLGIGVLYASLNITYRDFRHVLGFLMQIWMFATPTIYIPDFYDHQAGQQPVQTPIAVASQAAAGGDKLATTAMSSNVPAEASAEKSSQTPTNEPSRWAKARKQLSKLVSVRDLNPLTAIISFFRAIIVGGHIPWLPLLKAAITTTLILTVGLIYFRRVEGGFADII